ncbi:MAG: AhpC/TSA family protein [Armatimonadetes bacterium]|nr:AhpC/TSA family protein [Armatimonadota bacterium]
MDGKATTLKAALGGKKTVLVFYRGGWCPFCNAHLADLGKSEKDIEAAGWQIVAITPDLPENIAKTVEGQKLGYQIYSDSEASALKAFGVAFRVDDATYDKYKNQFSLDLEKWSGQPHHILPVPSLFLIDGSGKIRFTHSNPDYKVRLKASEVLSEIKRVGAGQ